MYFSVPIHLSGKLISGKFGVIKRQGGSAQFYCNTSRRLNYLICGVRRIRTCPGCCALRGAPHIRFDSRHFTSRNDVGFSEPRAWQL
jgi:hypothetical protein